MILNLDTLRSKLPLFTGTRFYDDQQLQIKKLTPLEGKELTKEALLSVVNIDRSFRGKDEVELLTDLTWLLTPKLRNEFAQFEQLCLTKEIVRYKNKEIELLKVSRTSYDSFDFKTYANELAKEYNNLTIDMFLHLLDSI